MTYVADAKRYDQMIYNYCGKSGLKVPAISLGLYRNFGSTDDFENAKNMIFTAFDLGITHFDLANNYGEPRGSAEEIFGKILVQELKGYRDELLISTKAGYDMWPGPYGDFGSRKYMLASLDQSLKRLQLDYVDIYYSHRYDPNTPLEETIGALDAAVKQGKALYVGISNYPLEKTKEAIKLFRELNTPFIVHQFQYSMFLRDGENGMFDLLEEEGIGAIVYQPLYQGLLTMKYVNGIPKTSRIAQNVDSISADQITEERIEKVKKLNVLAERRGQSVPQLAISWVLRQKAVASALIGARNPEQIVENVKSIQNLSFTEEELTEIENILE
ncbi:L-glyceraldehyde 3-phosphate reductase [Anoxybacillus tepidamans]|uniref:L-glyceraldehyde 3-phosphate reductase n=1 Tax=Anoxybacteroides tepidamans TaxID=265948 RepID=A0A7W8IS60_9BACL|nr:aldo/keto reductase [Anoxybacillus tepidamans]MBB5325733.1 L-glyceraldehyde 3-phosphate reductase [Anoxybacillus tepidamans]